MKKEEHWKLNNDGSLAGVYGLDLTKVSGSIWGPTGLLTQVIENWTRLHPVEMATHLRDVHNVSLDQKNKFASAKSGLRYGCSVPSGLGMMLEIVEPELFKNKRLLHKFMKEYPGFRVAQVT